MRAALAAFRADPGADGALLLRGFRSARCPRPRRTRVRAPARTAERADAAGGGALARRARRLRAGARRRPRPGHRPRPRRRRPAALDFVVGGARVAHRDRVPPAQAALPAAALPARRPRGARRCCARSRTSCPISTRRRSRSCASRGSGRVPDASFLERGHGRRARTADGRGHRNGPRSRSPTTKTSWSAPTRRRRPRSIASGRAVRAHATAVVLEAGDLLVIDNHRVVHGRSPFHARFDGTRPLAATHVRRLGSGAVDRGAHRTHHHDPVLTRQVLCADGHARSINRRAR